MRFNDDSLKIVSRNLTSPDKEARLLYKAPKESYKERWFKLKGNLVFIYRTNDHGIICESEACGILYLERCKFQMEPMGDRPFVFCGIFQGEGDKKHFFSAQTLQQCHDWITVLTQASYENVKAQLRNFQGKILRRTGRDPLPALVENSCPQLVKKNKAARPNTTISPQYRNVNSDDKSSTFYRRSEPPKAVVTESRTTGGATMPASGFQAYNVSNAPRAPKPTRPAPAIPTGHARSRQNNSAQSQKPSNSIAEAPLIDFDDGIGTGQNLQQIPCNVGTGLQQSSAKVTQPPVASNQNLDPFGFQPFATQKIPRPASYSELKPTEIVPNIQRDRPRSKSPIPDSFVTAFDQLATKAKSISFPKSDSLFGPNPSQLGSNQQRWEKFE